MGDHKPKHNTILYTEDKLAVCRVITGEMGLTFGEVDPGLTDEEDFNWLQSTLNAAGFHIAKIPQVHNPDIEVDGGGYETQASIRRRTGR